MFDFTVLRIQRSGDLQVGERYSLSCAIAESDSGNYSSLTWTDSHGRVLMTDSSGSRSSLELEFESLQLSDVGNYTCSVNFTNGDSRQLTEQILAAGRLSLLNSNSL